MTGMFQGVLGGFIRDLRVVSVRFRGLRGYQVDSGILGDLKSFKDAPLEF